MSCLPVFKTEYYELMNLCMYIIFMSIRILGVQYIKLYIVI